MRSIVDVFVMTGGRVMGMKYLRAATHSICYETEDRAPVRHACRD
ncbi:MULTISPECIES: hypothetical protein [unclassified Rhodococcus (in: high G+C Gram-positive bacteria)]|nr:MULTISPECIES: hypothetical protein [unclassified Rhodococcus (in: high G+C Gram-positive bacteria)]